VILIAGLFAWYPPWIAGFPSIPVNRQKSVREHKFVITLKNRVITKLKIFAQIPRITRFSFTLP
jgi:hypothetical protein